MGLDVSNTLLSYDVFSCAWSPLTSSSSSCRIGQQLACPHIKRRRVARNIFASVSLFFSASRFSRLDNEAEHVTKQPANTKECISDTIQHCVSNEMGCGACAWWCAWAGRSCFLSLSLFCRDCPPSASPRFPWFPLHVKECGCSGWSAQLFIVLRVWPRLVLGISLTWPLVHLQRYSACPLTHDKSYLSNWHFRHYQMLAQKQWNDQ